MPFRAAWLAPLALILLAPLASAHDFTIDQHCEPSIWSEHSIRAYSPIGQEFVPARSRLDVVELWIDGTLDPPPASLRVRVHADSIAGPVLGESDTVGVTHTSWGPAHFDFSPPVAITPGALHVIEVVVVAGDGNPMLCSGDDAGYAPGRAVMQGGFGYANDFWFRTGLDSSVPVLASTWGRLKALYR